MPTASQSSVLHLQSIRCAGLTEASTPARAQHQLFRAKELLTHLAEVIGLAGGGGAAPHEAGAAAAPAGARALEAGAMSAQECGALARDLLALILECLGAPLQLLYLSRNLDRCLDAVVFCVTGSQDFD